MRSAAFETDLKQAYNLVVANMTFQRFRAAITADEERCLLTEAIMQTLHIIRNGLCLKQNGERYQPKSLYLLVCTWNKSPFTRDEEA